MPDDDGVAIEGSKPTPAPQQPAAKGGILVTIKTRDGLQIQKSGLDYQGLKLLVERLEGLC